MEKYEEQVRFLISLKLSTLKRNGNEDLTYKQVEDALWLRKWAKRFPAHLCDIVNDINSLTLEDIEKEETSLDELTEYDIDALVSNLEGDINEEKQW